MDVDNLFSVKVRTGSSCRFLHGENNRLAIARARWSSSQEVSPPAKTTGSGADHVSGAKGIGYMISQGFVAAGAKVYIASRDAQACEKAAADLNALGRGT